MTEYADKPAHVGQLPPSELTPEAREYKRIVCSRLNRCPHGVNVVMRKCHECELEGRFVGDVVEGPNRA